MPLLFFSTRLESMRVSNEVLVVSNLSRLATKGCRCVYALLPVSKYLRPVSKYRPKT